MSGGFGFQNVITNASRFGHLRICSNKLLAKNNISLVSFFLPTFASKFIDKTFESILKISYF